MRTSTTKFLAVFVSLPLMGLLLFGCSDNKERIHNEATAYCSVFKAQNWDSNKQMSVQESHAEISSRAHSALKSKEFKPLLNTYAEKLGKPDFHHHVENEISKIIDAKWDCPDHKKFFTISSFSRESGIEYDQTAPLKEPAQSITLTIDKDGNFYVDSSEALSNTLELKAELLKVLNQNNRQIILQADGDARFQSVVSAMDVCKALGVTNISIATAKPN